MDKLSNQLENTSSSINDIFSKMLGDNLANLLFVIALLIIGFIIAKFLQKIITKLIGKTGIDRKLSNSKINLSKFIGKLVYFLAMIFVFMLALEKLGMTNVLEPVKGLLNGFLDFVPNIVGAGLVGYIGYMLATIVSELVGLSGETIQKFLPKLKLPENLNIVVILKKVVFIFIFIPLLIAALNILNLDAVSNPATDMLASFFDAIPRILVATLILIVFIVGGKYLSELVKSLLDSLNINEFMKKANLTSLVGKNNIEGIIANIVYAFIVLFGLITAVEKLEFNKLSEILNTVVSYGGNILFGLAIIVLGSWIGKIVSNNIIDKQNAFIKNIINAAIISIFLAIGLRSMGIANDIINLAFGIILGAIALTIVLSFGLGGREAAGKQMQKIIDKFNN